MNWEFDFTDRPMEPCLAWEDPEEWSEIAGWAEWADEKCEEMFDVLLQIAEMGRDGHVYTSSIDVCRDMRRAARHAVETYGRQIQPDDC